MTRPLPHAQRVLHDAFLHLGLGRATRGSRIRYCELAVEHPPENDYLVIDDIFAGRMQPDCPSIGTGYSDGRFKTWLLRDCGDFRIGVELDPRMGAPSRTLRCCYRMLPTQAGSTLTCHFRHETRLDLANPPVGEVLRQPKTHLLGDTHGEAGVVRLHNNGRYHSVFTDSHISAVDLLHSTTDPFDRMTHVRLPSALPEASGATSLL